MEKIFEMVGINTAHTLREALELFNANGADIMKVMPKGKDDKPIGLLLICGPDDAEKISNFVDSLGEQ